MVTHDAAFARRAQRSVRLSDGRIVEELSKKSIGKVARRRRRAARSLWATPRYSLPGLASLILGGGGRHRRPGHVRRGVLPTAAVPRAKTELVRVRVVFLASDVPEGGSPRIRITKSSIEGLKSVFQQPVSAWIESNVTVTAGGEARHANGASVTPEFIDTL